MAVTKGLKIRHKLFAVFVLSNILLIVSMWQVFQWSFDRGFVSYATERDRDFLEQMANRTANLYIYYDDWYFLVQESRMEREWYKAKVENLRDLVPPPSTPNLDLIYPSQYYRQRFLLFDAKENPIIGKTRFTDAETHAVTVNKKVVGYVGLRSIRELVQDQTLRFVRQQGEAFLLISAFMLAIAALLTWPLAQWLSRPIISMQKATKKLAAGKFDTRISVKGADELASLSCDFNNLACTLEHTREARKRWVADTAHELRTPVAILRGEIEAMQDGIIKMTPESLSSLHQETLHIARLIDDLNQLSMHDVGSLSYEMEDISINEIIEQTVQSMTLPFNEAGLELEFEYSQKSPIVMNGDSDRLHQLFSNLMNNSLKYTNAPGGLTVKLAKKNKKAIILFEDTAPGVSDEDKNRIFEQFFRIENSRNRATGGRGLGLAICASIVDGHQGTISAYHSPDGGLGIKVEFPLNYSR
ncbi:HAMP domain-containing protein [Marinomonas rhizomae]|uniref:histidine kinase n=1 Tax=Marinomonas rhizomae TaxID=491948 RepID=A0A366JAV8_9GAMM|nr:ATP-binding protein [Marinomonas rhizomae]RBP84141.1 two-component system sensor histidine kinase BaeS [Marinomonas rhizomae]RNF74472.1 HAMP domain-containing protein [Marinomonas rhizomae]